MRNETLVIDGDRIWWDESSEFTEKQQVYLISRGRLEYHPPLVEIKEEEKPKQKPSTLLLNLMRNI